MIETQTKLSKKIVEQSSIVESYIVKIIRKMKNKQIQDLLGCLLNYNETDVEKNNKKVF